MKLQMSAVLLAIAAAHSVPAQTLTARQLFYKDDAEAKPTPKAAPKPTTKKDVPKPAAKKAPPTQAAPPPASSEVPTPKTEPARVTNAAYTSTERPLGLRYALVQVVSGAESEVSPTATFHSGDMVRVRVEGNRDGYLYVIARGSSGNWKPLFPAPDINGGENQVVARHNYSLPSSTQAFTFDEQAGQEQLFVIYSAEPVKDIDALIPSLEAPGKTPAPGAMVMASAAPMNDEFVSRLRNTYSRDLIVQTVGPSQPSEARMPENAVYVVNKSGGRLVADIRLEHR
jgi:hypothetical protein